MIGDNRGAADSMKIILERDYPNHKKLAACKKMGQRLHLHPKTLVMISNGGYCGKRTARKLQSLVDHPPRVRHDKPRICVPVASEEERQQINTLTAQEKRSALLVASKGSQ